MPPSSPTADFNAKNIAHYLTLPPHLLAKKLSSLLNRDLVNLLIAANQEQLPNIIEQLAEEKFCLVIPYLPDDIIQQIMALYSEASQKKIVNLLWDDDRVDLLQDFPEEKRNHLIALLEKKEQKVTRQLLSYPEDSAGGRMTMNFARLYLGMTVKDALDQLRDKINETETLARILLVDKNNKIIGKIRLRALAFSSWDTMLADIVEKETITVLATDDQEKVAQIFLTSNTLILPVTDTENRLLGIITQDDAMRIMKEESTEDIEKMAGIAADNDGNSNYLYSSAWLHIKKRFFWLLVLGILGIFSGYMLMQYEGILSKTYLLALYLPMIIAAGGNSGGQASAMIIRAMALEEVTHRHFLQIFYKELRIGLALGIIVGFGIALLSLLLLPFFDLSASCGLSIKALSIIVFLSLLLQIITSTLIGGTLPIIAKSIRLDPAVIASPLITTLVDIIGIIIYFMTAQSVISYLCPLA